MSHNAKPRHDYRIVVEYFEPNAGSHMVQGERVELTKSLWEQDRAKVEIGWEDWSVIRGDMDRTATGATDWNIYIDGKRELGGLLSDYKEKDNSVELTIADWEEYARIAPMAGGDASHSNEDEDIVAQNAVNRMNGGTPDVEFSTGSLANTKTVSFDYPFMTPAEELRKLAQITGREINWKPDEEVDYLESLGSDKTSNPDQLLTPGGLPGHTEERITLEKALPRLEHRLNYTHVHVLGSGSGSTRTQATATRSDFDSTSDREHWYKHEDGRIDLDATAQRIADQLISEIESAKRLIVTDLHGVQVEPPPIPGDWYRVEDPRHGVNDDIRLTEVVRTLSPTEDRWDAKGTNVPEFVKQDTIHRGLNVGDI